MQNKSILSVAILKANWDVRGIDYVENFVPLLLHLLKNGKYDEIKIDKLKIDFENEFGLCIPYHPIETILIRLKNKSFVYKKDQKYFFNSTIDGASNFEEVRDNQGRKLNKLTQSLINFCKNVHSYDVDNITAEKALVSFFQENGLGLLSATKEKSSLPDVETDKTLKFCIAKFIENAKSIEPEIFRFLVDIAIGVALANTIVYGQNLTNFSGKIDNLHLYLDTGYLFALLGVNGKEKEDAFSELTKTMVELGAHLYVFEHTYDEVYRILNGALFWMNQVNYDPQKASRVLKYFIDNDFKASDVEMFIAQAPNVLSKYKIQKAPKPDYSENIQYQIDEADLKKLIIESYKNDPFFDETVKDETINKDVESVYSICKLRKGKIAFTLKNASFIFITTNKSLARISTLVQSADNAHYAIPPCITDILIGTLVWLQNPVKTLILNEKKLIADAYAAVQPDSSLIKKYLEEVDSLKQKWEITENEYYILRTNRVAFNLLSERTKNDVHNFNPKTTREIMDEINEKHLANLKESINEKEILNKRTSQELESAKQELEKEKGNSSVLSARSANMIHIFTKIITWILISVIVPLIIFLTFISFFQENFNLFWKILSFIIITGLSIFGFSLLNFKTFLSGKIENFLKEKFEFT